MKTPLDALQNDPVHGLALAPEGFDLSTRT